MEKPKKTGSLPSLYEVELEVEAEGRDWTRRRLQQRLQELADQNGGVFPPKPATGSAPEAPPQKPEERRRDR